MFNQNNRAKSIVSAFESDFKEIHENDRKNADSAQSRRQTAFVEQITNHLNFANLLNSSDFASFTS